MKKIFRQQSQRAFLALSCGIVLMTAGCFRSASDEAIVTTPTTAPTLLAPPAAEATSDVQVIIVTPPTPTETVVQPPTAFPTLTPASSDANTVPTLTPTLDLLLVTPTREPSAGAFSGTPTITFITPGSPLGFITPDPVTPTPIGFDANAATVTPAVPGGSGLGTNNIQTTDEAVSDECIYVVQPGDTLFGIAIAEDVAVSAIRAANPDMVGTDPILQIDQEILMPYDGCPGYVTPTATSTRDVTPSSAPEGSGELYTVQPGDTLSNIAARFGVTVRAIVDANELTNPDRLDVGDELIIPLADN